MNNLTPQVSAQSPQGTGNAARSCPDDLWQIGARAVERARRWADDSADEPTPRPAKLLSQVLADPDGLELTTRFVDDVIRPTDLEVAGAALRRLAKGRTSFLPAPMAAALGLGGLTSRVAPRTVAAIARRTFREIVGDLVVDATEAGLASALARLRRGGNRLNVNLLGEAVLGEAEAAKRLAEVSRLVARDDIDYVSVKVSAVTGPHNPWGFDEVVAHGVEVLTPLYRKARDHGTFLNLDMEDYKDLDLTIAVFTAILDQEDLTGYEAGIVLQAYLPDSLAAMQRLQSWAAARVAAGGSRIKVRVVKGANLSMEKVDAEIHGWELTTWPTKQATDTNYKRILEWAMTPERTANIRLGVAGQNLFDIAFAYELRAARGLDGGDAVEFEMLSGMATELQTVVRRDTGHLLLYVPVVHPDEFDVAISYLVRRLEENAAPVNFMSGVFDIAKDEAVFARERDRFLASLEDLAPDAPVPAPNRIQNRQAERDAGLPEVNGALTDWARRPFVNEADSDPALASNREWARQIAASVPGSTRGVDAVGRSAAALTTTRDADALIGILSSAAESWRSRGVAERAAILHRVGDVLAVRRGDRQPRTDRGPQKRGDVDDVQGALLAPDPPLPGPGFGFWARGPLPARIPRRGQVGPVTLIRVDPGRQVQDAIAQLLQPRGAQVSDHHPGVPAAGDLDGQLPQAEDAPQKRVNDVDRLDPRQARDTQLLVEKPRTQVHGVGIDPVGAHPPGQEEHQAHDDQQAHR